MKDVAQQKGFTLIEILVAVLVALVLTGTILAVTTGVLNLWRRTQDNFTTGAQARLVLDFLERDLQAAVVRDDGRTWLAVDMQNSAAALVDRGWLTNGAIKPVGLESQRYFTMSADGSVAEITAARFGLSGAWLRLISTNVESDGSLPVAISYQIARRPVSGAISADNRAAVRYSLFRAAVSPELTFASGYDVLATDYRSNTTAPGATRAASTLSNPSNTDVIATNVVDFGVWFYTRDVRGALLRVFPAIAAGDVSYRVASVTAFPAVADVTVRILTEDGARRVAALEQQEGVTAEDWWEMVEANSQVFVRRITVGGPGR